MKLHISHYTAYRYDEKVSLSPQRILLHPREDHVIRVLEYRIDIKPEGRIHRARDCYDTRYVRVRFPELTDILEVRVEALVEINEFDPFDFLLENNAASIPFQYDESDLPVLRPYIEDTLPGAEYAVGWLREICPDPRGETVPFLSKLNLEIHRCFRYERREESGILHSGELLRLGKGSCRDFAVFFMSVCRSCGLAARFVSGYLYESPEEASQLPAAGALHAWVEVFLPGTGWKGFDPTNGIVATHHFIPVAVARDPEAAGPIQGRYYADRPVGSSMKTELDIRAV